MSQVFIDRNGDKVELVRFSDWLAADHVTRSRWTQKTFGRTWTELSNGIKFDYINFEMNQVSVGRNCKSERVEEQIVKVPRPEISQMKTGS